MTLVVDASMAIAWLFVEEQSKAVMDILNRASDEGICVPSLWKLEVANVLRTAVRRKQCDEKFVEASLQDLGRLQLVIDAHTDDHAWGQTRELAAAYDLSLYDAAYLELAMRRKEPLATCDRALAKSARRAGVEVLLG